MVVCEDEVRVDTPTLPNLPHPTTCACTHLHPPTPVPTRACRPLVEERIRERQRMRSMNNLPPVDDLHRKPQHREGLTIPEGSLQHAI